MYLSELRIWNFRRFGTKKLANGSESPGLSLRFNEGLNLLVGENDSGKTAIVDAIKLIILTQSREYIRLEYEDFHIPPELHGENERSNWLRIECIFRGFENKEAKNFLEWLGIEKGHSGKEEYFLRAFLKAERKGLKIPPYNVKAGPDEEGLYLEGEARDLLRGLYLKPLRDAESELIPGRRSRLAQILNSHDAFDSSGADHRLLWVTKNANRSIQNYFKGLGDDDKPLPDQAGKQLLEDINTYLSKFFTENEKNKVASFSIADPELKSILEKLILDLVEAKAGLGSYNRLYIAAELLLLKREDYTGLKLALVEEIEAHLHPQAQLRLIEYLHDEISVKSKVQLILTTHSPNLASKVKLRNLIICKNGSAFPMDSSSTELEKGDYLFLERFLDVTKANLFFAQGVILVEGHAENLLIPVIAEIIGKPLSQYGVSIVDVNGIAFLRYSRIFRRKNLDRGEMGIPVSVVIDNDIPPDKGLEEAQVQQEKTKKAARYDGQGVKTFISPVWTLEYDISLSSIRDLFYKAVLRAEKIQNSDQIGLTTKKISEIEKQFQIDFVDWTGRTRDQVASKIFKDIIQQKNISKAIIAQCFTDVLKQEEQGELRQRILDDHCLKYLVGAINHACS
ncbi:MAG: AAA family ATPase [Desulfobaccales bacterium]|jgi:putative ATP-dependent endonuclease of OLD family